MLAILCPGQGAQSAGFLAPWLDFDGVADRLRWLSAAAGLDLLALGSSTDADVVDTAVAQPLIVAAGLASAELLGPLPRRCVLVGHSVGELTAAGVSGALDDASTMTLARERGRAMAIAAAAAPSGMTAILGGSADEVTVAIERAGCVAANRNAAGQVVAAGTTESLERLANDPPPGARLRPLAVAGAFHTPLMSSAQHTLASLVAGLPVNEPTIPLVANGDGALVTSGRTLLDRLVQQVTHPVRFDLCLQALRDMGVTATIELVPGGVLTALVRRELPDVASVALRSPSDLHAARSLVAAQADEGEPWSPTWRVVVSPAGGTFHADAMSVGDAIGRQTSIGAVHNRSGEVPVSVVHGGELLEWLTADGDPVAPGQPIARLHPVASA